MQEFLHCRKLRSMIEKCSAGNARTDKGSMPLRRPVTVGNTENMTLFCRNGTFDSGFIDKYVVVFLLERCYNENTKRNC